MKRSILFAAVGLLISFNACALRIVSLSPYLTESIILLDAESHLAGITSIDRDMFGLDQEVVGDTLNINIEKIVSLNPDIIIATPMNKPERLEKLKEMGYKIEFFALEKSFNDCCSNFLRLASLVGKDTRAEYLIEASKERLLKINSLTDNIEKKKIFVEVGSNPLITAGRDCYLNDILNNAGFDNAAQEIAAGFFRITEEKVLSLNPDYILIISGDSAQGLKRWERYVFLKAVKRNGLIAVCEDSFSRPNPVSFVESVRLLIKTVYPDIDIYEN